MKDLIRFFLPLLFILTTSWNSLCAQNIRVLILNDIYSGIPAKNEKLERVGKIKGDVLVMGTGYSGNIEIWKGEKGLYVINELPLEEYIKDVVAAEVPADWDMEALKVQAVISRTYALYQKKMNNNSLYNIASSVIHQVYKGKSPDVRISYAVSQTEGEILTYNGRPIETFYHSTCGGRTENPEEVFGKRYPYLRSTESTCDLSPYSSWERRLPFEEVEKALDIPGISRISIKSFTSTNRIKELNITSKKGISSINATDFRKSLGWSRVPSTNFTISRDGGELVLKGRGYGHGVGLCQWCALRMAREGKNYREILSFFYPGTAIQAYEDR